MVLSKSIMVLVFPFTRIRIYVYHLVSLAVGLNNKTQIPTHPPNDDDEDNTSGQSEYQDEARQQEQASSDDDFTNYFLHVDDIHTLLTTVSDASDDTYAPQSYKDAITCKSAPKWIESILSENSSLIKNNTWYECKVPPGKKALPCKWVFKIKRKADGTIDRYKARLVIKGFRQIPGSDYNETFSPVVRLTIIRMMLALAAKFDLDIYQVDVSTAFLNGDLEEEIYMQGPEGTEFEGKTVRLSFMAQNDIVLVTKDKVQKDLFKSNLAATFDIHDLGEIKHLLGIKIERNRVSKSISLSQSQYVKKLLQKFLMDKCNPVSTPANDKLDQSKNSGVDKAQYRFIVGALMYLMVATRPDLAYAVGKLSSQLQDPSNELLQLAKRVLRYLKGTQEYCITIDGNKSVIPKGYADANYAADTVKRRSITGSTIIMCSAAISWKSKLQPVTAKSTPEAEYYAADYTASELMHCRHVLQELNLGFSECGLDLCLNAQMIKSLDDEANNWEPLVINQDNKSTIAITNNPQSYHKTKHIETRYHYIRDQVESRKIVQQYCPTAEQVADIFTKSLPVNVFKRHCESLGLRYRFT
ncbi:hypothetical protein MIR68_008221 [Amoeboaphelidium protococcarum]|nr:hypothetical protein MIR68_008221 [Amoeboaphelidium protococcarum]